MNARRAIGAAAFLCLVLPCPLRPQTAPAKAADIVTSKRSLVFPIVPAKGEPVLAKECAVTLGPASPVTAVAFSPDGKTLAAAGYREVLLWNLAEASLARRIGTGKIGGSVHALAFDKAGHVLLVAEGAPQKSGAVRLFDPATGEQKFEFADFKDVVYALALSPDGKRLAAGGAEGFVHVWDLEEKKVLATIKDHGDWVLGLCFTPDGKYLATGGADRMSRVWETATWKVFSRMPEADAVQGVALSPDGKSLAVAVGGPAENTVRLRSIEYEPPPPPPGSKTPPPKRSESLKLVRNLETGGGMPLDVFWHLPADRVLVPCSDRTVKLFKGTSSTIIASLAGHSDWVYGAVMSLDGTRIATGSGDGTVRLWSGADGRPLAVLAQLSPRADEGLVLTTPGYYAAPETAVLQWRGGDPKDPPEKMKEHFGKRESLLKALEGAAPAPEKPPPKPSAPAPTPAPAEKKPEKK
jgi:WD40 repeat protein